MGYTDHPKDFGWWPFEEAKKLIAGVGQEKKLELVPYQPSRLQIVLRQSRNYPPQADKQRPLGWCLSANLGETL